MAPEEEPAPAVRERRAPPMESAMQTEIRAPGSSRRILLGASSLFLSCLLASGVAGAGAAAQSGTSRYIVQGPDAEVVAERIRALGGRVSSELPLINGVGAELTTAQARALGKDGALRLLHDCAGHDHRHA